MKTIELTQGKATIVDDEDYEWLKQWTWYYHHEGYALRNETISGKPVFIFMHREILGTPKGMETDHINMNGLDNRKNNLRICTHSQNHANRGKQSNNTSGYKGVYWNKVLHKWRARIKINNKYIHLGYFYNIQEAAKAYEEAAPIYFGEFARI